MLDRMSDPSGTVPRRKNWGDCTFEPTILTWVAMESNQLFGDWKPGMSAQVLVDGKNKLKINIFYKDYVLASVLTDFEETIEENILRILLRTCNEAKRSSDNLFFECRQWLHEGIRRQNDEDFVDWLKKTSWVDLKFKKIKQKSGQ